jgi:RNA polymerase sigma-70 factor (ECF subfamily)
MSQTADREALFRTWGENHRAIFHKVARSYARSQSEFDELFQEMWFQLWVSTKSFSGAAKPSTWIYRVCLNTALGWRRRAQRRAATFDTSSVTDFSVVPSGGATPSELVGKQDMLEHLFAAIHQLEDGDRALILLSLEGVSYAEIAEIIGSSENRVGVALTRARQRLAGHLKGIINELE